MKVITLLAHDCPRQAIIATDGNYTVNWSAAARAKTDGLHAVFGSCTD